MASSHIVPRQLDEEIPRDNDACQEFETQDQEVPVVKIPEWYAYLFRLKTETAAMARQSDQSTKVIRGKFVAVMDCGASQTITCSLINCKDVMGNVTIIETANAFFVKGLLQDLLGGKFVNHENIQVILDSDHDICSFPLDKNYEQHYQESIDFTSSGDTIIGGHERAMHIDLRKHFAHETIQNRMMCLIKIDTFKQLADIFSKRLSYTQFIRCVRGILGDPDAMRQTKVHALQARLSAGLGHS